MIVVPISVVVPMMRRPANPYHRGLRRRELVDSIRLRVARFGGAPPATLGGTSHRH